MSEFFDKVTQDQDIFKKILGKIPGFDGYIKRQNRRASDKLLREFISDRFQEQEQRISALQRDLISQGGIEYIDDLEAADIKLRQFIDRIRTASYGYSSLFAAVKINEKELEQIYQYDAALLDLVDETSRAIDNLETSIGTDGLPAAIRNLTSVSQKCVEAFNKRTDVITSSAAPSESQ
jgi:hypothetical protein